MRTHARQNEPGSDRSRAPRRAPPARRVPAWARRGARRESRGGSSASPARPGASLDVTRRSLHGAARARGFPSSRNETTAGGKRNTRAPLRGARQPSVRQSSVIVTRRRSRPRRLASSSVRSAVSTYGRKLVSTRTEPGSTRPSMLATSITASTRSPNSAVARRERRLHGQRRRVVRADAVGGAGAFAAPAPLPRGRPRPACATAQRTRPRRAGCVPRSSRPPQGEPGVRPTPGRRRAPPVARSHRSPPCRCRARPTSRGGRQPCARSPRVARVPPRGAGGRARTVPLTGSASGSVTPATSGNDRSQTGSWTTTGTRSQPAPRAARSSAGDGGVRKSDSRNTNVPGGTSAGDRVSWASTVSTPPDGAARLGTAASRRRSISRGAPRSRPERVSHGPAAPLSAYPTSACAARALGEDHAARHAHRRPACAATGGPPGRAPSTGCDRRSATRARRPRRGGRGRRTRRCRAQSTGAPRRASRRACTASPRR